MCLDLADSHLGSYEAEPSMQFWVEMGAKHTLTINILAGY